MGAIATGTVVRWKIANKGHVNERVEFVGDAKVSVYIADGGEDDDATAILAKYILDEVAAKQSDPANPGKVEWPIAKPLLDDACAGLLRVGDIHRATVTRPALP
jgi:hypothetical protein